jgi:hypothetical protein
LKPACKDRLTLPPTSIQTPSHIYTGYFFHPRYSLRAICVRVSQTDRLDLVDPPVALNLKSHTELGYPLRKGPYCRRYISGLECYMGSLFPSALMTIQSGTLSWRAINITLQVFQFLLHEIGKRPTTIDHIVYQVESSSIPHLFK